MKLVDLGRGRMMLLGQKECRTGQNCWASHLMQGVLVLMQLRERMWLRMMSLLVLLAPLARKIPTSFFLLLTSICRRIFGGHVLFCGDPRIVQFRTMYCRLQLSSA